MKLARSICSLVIIVLVACSTRTENATPQTAVAPTIFVTESPEVVGTPIPPVSQTLVATSSPAGFPPTNTPTPAQPTPPQASAAIVPSPITTLSLKGDFSNQSALQALYPDPRIVVTGLSVQRPLSGTGEEAITETLTIVLSEAYWEDNRLKHIVLLASDRMQNECVFCGAPISGAIFILDGDTWRLDIAHDNFAEVGSWGFPPRVRLIQIGPRKYGIAIENDIGAWGAVERSLYLFAALNGQLAQILMVPDIRVESADLAHEGQRILTVTSKYGFAAGTNSEYYDFTISSWTYGMEQPVFEQQTYVFNGIEYVKP